MARLAVRLQVVEIAVGLGLALLVARAAEVQPLRNVRGVHFEPVLNRFYPAPEMAHATIGRLGDDGRGASGLEKTLDSLLAGRPGAAVVLKDRAGREYESPARVIAQPESGLDVVLTLDAELQEIAQRALDEALRRMDADGGDVVMLDPATGELLAVASRRRDGSARPSAFTDTFEPGSVAKIFAAAGLLALHRVLPGERGLAIGYELSVTPLQLAAASGAIANDGVLLQPTLIREIRSPPPGGSVLYRHRPEPVRRAVTPDVARRLRELLHGAAQRGTGEEGTLATFQIAAKTGTARRVVGGRYAPGEYTASFAALFPADHPQLVVVVKIDNPRKGSYFAAHTAAPVTPAMLNQALAARQWACDRARLTDETPVALATPAAPPAEEDAGAPAVLPWPLPPESAAVVTVARRAIPDVTGLPLREAVRALHRRGFRVVLKGLGVTHHTWPAAGDSAAAGATVTLFGTRPSP